MSQQTASLPSPLEHSEARIQCGDGYVADPEAYDAWFRKKVKEALADTRPARPHKQVMDEAQTLIDRKRRARS